MELYIIEQFLLLSQTEHMTETANRLNITQSALSKNIAKLEAELGVKLFDRIGRNIRLNKYGENFARYAAQAAEALKAGVDTTRDVTYEVLGSIYIYFRAFSPILTNCIAAYSRLNPQVEFRLVKNIPSVKPGSQEPDFILSSSSDSGFRGNQIWFARELFQESYCAVISASCPALQHTLPASIADLENIPFIGMVLYDSFFTDSTYLFCQQANFVPRILYRSEGFLTKISLVKKGLGATIIPESCVPTAMELVPDLIVLPICQKEAVRSVFLLRKRKTFMSKAAEDFWDFVLDYYQLPPDTEE